MNSHKIVVSGTAQIYFSALRIKIMSFSKNAKKSVIYDFELTTSKMLAPVTRYKGYSKLYQLNLSKMLLKCPDSPFARQDESVTNPEQLVIVSTLKHPPSYKTKCMQNQSQSELCRTKFDKIKKGIRNNLMGEDHIRYQSQNQEAKELDDDVNRTAASPSSPNIIDFPPPENETARTSAKFNKHQIFKIARRRMQDHSTGVDPKIQSNLMEEKQLIKLAKEMKSEQLEPILTIQQRKLEPKKKHSFNNSNQQNILSRSKASKKVLLPGIKVTLPDKNKNHIYNISSKSNIPVLFRDPEQLKQVRAQSYSIVEYPTGNLILSNKAMNQYEIASLTKIMTFYTTMRIVHKYRVNVEQEKVRVNDVAMETSGTSAEIMAGEVYTVQQLLYGLMLPSGNDAATALAEWGGKFLINSHHPHLIINSNVHPPENNDAISLEESANLKQRIKMFIIEMNNNAKQLGLGSTRFANPHGLPHSQAKSTATDVARLCLECMKSDYFRKIVSTHSFKCTTHQHSNPQITRVVEWNNTNKLLRREGFLGIKTGITVTAGPCLASAYQFRDKIYICVVLRAPKVSRRFKETRKLLAWSLEKLYGDCLTSEQAKKIASLKRNKPDLDSDYSEDEQQFNYQQMSRAQFKKRSNIINYEM